MLLLLSVAFLSGLITILAPCIWPLLPIVLSTSISGGKAKSLGITFGIVLTFGIFNIAISYLVKLFGFDPNFLRIGAVFVLVLLGILMVIPKLSQVFEGLISRLSGKFAQNKPRYGFVGGLITGASLGIVWTPCAGPILAAISTLAATSRVNFGIILVSIFYLTGVAIPLFFFSYAGQKFIADTRLLNKYLGSIQQFFGIILLLAALAIATNFDKKIQTKILDLLPSYSNLLTNFENNPKVKKQISNLKGTQGSGFSQSSQGSNLGNLGKAPEFAGITKWLNPEKPLTMESLRGKVVLVDFWTYTCINCIRTLPFVRGWYDKYKDQGFVVVGVHTPEFEFEKNTNNVAQAIKDYKIHYPVAQDNDYKTWNAFGNEYWPAKYLIDKEGNIRYSHFGEGKYEETEKNIQALLKEAGTFQGNGLVTSTDQTPKGTLTPETYLGLKRQNRLASLQKPSSGKQIFTPVDNLPEDYFALGGTWDLEGEYAQSIKDSTLKLNFYASKVFLVITPKSKNDLVKVYLDGRPVDEKTAGSDVTNGQVNLDTPRLYSLIDLKGRKDGHILKLEFQTEDTQIFAFTFG